MLVAGLVAGAIITFATTYPQTSSVGTFTSVSTTTDTVTATSVSTTTTTTVSTITTFPVNLTATLADAYLSHVGAIESENATALASQYETNATLLVASQSFDGSGNITGFYAENPCSICFLADGPFYPYSHDVANDTYSIAMSNSTLKTGTVTSHLILYGDATHACCYPSFSSNAYYYIIGFDVSYVLQGDRWLISTESLTDSGLNYCDAISISPDGNVFTCQGLPS